ncbi:MAG TPA: GIY-YIG nuclease family protein [Candidatus Udaeobacter sp.]|nr:GIY-YIG nuclease family protein [Candidatus Udaeobacter sp.]
MAWVYVLRDSSGRHYIGSMVDLDAPFAQHLRGHTATTKDLETNWKLVPKLPTLVEAREIERSLKRKKNPKLAIYYLER